MALIRHRKRSGSSPIHNPYFRLNTGLGKAEYGRARALSPIAYGRCDRYETIHRFEAALDTVVAEVGVEC